MPPNLPELLNEHGRDTRGPALPQDYVESTVHKARRRAVRRRAARGAAGTGVAAVAALALVAGVGVLGGTPSGRPAADPAASDRTPADPDGTDRAATGGPGRRPAPVDLTDAKALLVSASLTAAEDQRAAPRADQFIHTRFLAVDSGGRTTGESWVSVDGSRKGYIIQAGKDGRGPVGYHSVDIPDPNLMSPTYTFLTTLPTDPDALYAMIRAEVDAVVRAQGDKVTDPDQYAFQMIGELLHQAMVPPKLAAALYQAAARIPGVTLVRDAVDAAGRHGVAVARTEDQGGLRESWIFDRSTLQYRGRRVVEVASKHALMDVAVLGQDVVDTLPPRADNPDPVPSTPRDAPPPGVEHGTARDGDGTG